MKLSIFYDIFDFNCNFILFCDSAKLGKSRTDPIVKTIDIGLSGTEALEYNLSLLISV
jgi:hypothetical protein